MADQPTCLLPVVRAWSNDDFAYHREHRIEPCGELVRYYGFTCTDDFAEPTPYEISWELKCDGGHVLLLVDDEDHEVSLTPALVDQAFNYLDRLLEMP